MTALTDRFSQAVDYARIAHAAQFRKGSSIPYIHHLLGVAWSEDRVMRRCDR